MNRYFARLAQRSEAAADARPRSAPAHLAKSDPVFAEHSVEVIAAAGDAIPVSTEAAPPPTALDSNRMAAAGTDFVPSQSSGTPSLPSVERMESLSPAVARPQQAAMTSSATPVILRATAVPSERPATDRDAAWIEASGMTESDAASPIASHGAHASTSDLQHPTEAAWAGPHRIGASTTSSTLAAASADSLVNTPSTRTTVARSSQVTAPVTPRTRITPANDAVVQVNIGRIELEISAPAPTPVPILAREPAPPPPASHRFAPFNPHRHCLRGS